MSTDVPAPPTDQPLAWLARAGLTPPVHETLVALDDALWAGSFDPVLMELLRLRTAQLLGVEAELTRRTPAASAAGLDDALVAELPQWPTSPRFDDRSRAAIAWAEQWIVDVHGITDTDAARLQDLFTPAELAGLTMAIAVFEMTIRARAALGAD
jgi:alkylhydroperoxidase family enzyme